MGTPDYPVRCIEGFEDVAAFRMPVRVNVAKDRMDFIYPTTTAQTMELPGMTKQDFAVDTANFYFTVQRP